MPELFLLTFPDRPGCYLTAGGTYTDDIADAALFDGSEPPHPTSIGPLLAIPAIGPVDDAIEAAAARIKKLAAMASRMGLTE